MALTRRRKIHSKRNDQDATVLTPKRYNNLVSEMSVILDGDIFPTPSAREKCYLSNKAEILESWLAVKDNYCYRPFAFWEFEKLPKRKILYYHRWWDPLDGPAHWELSPEEEKDFQYLFRLGLLREKELGRYNSLKAEADVITESLKDIGGYVSVEEAKDLAKPLNLKKAEGGENTAFDVLQ